MSFSSQILRGLPQGNFTSQPSDPGFQEKIPSGYRKYAMQNFTPEQMQLFQQLFSHLSPEGDLSKLAAGDEGTFNEMEIPALRQFNELQGNIASRFSGMGMGARNSSGFKNATNAAASDFASQLQANRQGLQRQALNDLMGISSNLLGQQPYTTGLAEKRQKPGGFLSSLGSFGGALPGFLTGGSQGAAQGAKMTANALAGF